MVRSLTVRWTAHHRLSAVHAAYVVASGAACVDPRLEAALVEPVTDVNNRLLSASVDISRFWQRLIIETMAERSENVRSDTRSCEIALAAAGISELQLESTGKAVTSRLDECRAVFSNRHPKLAEQLRLRAGPLRERWETYGPGLMRLVAESIWEGSPPADWWPGRVDGLLVQPVRGGDGGLDADTQRFWVEALLTDADPLVPEVVRVAWLISRMVIEAHTREKSGHNSRRLPWAIGSLPVVLSAAAELELVPSTQVPIAAAVERWNLGDAQIAETVQRWWDQRQQSAVAMPVALKALERMLAPQLENGGHRSSSPTATPNSIREFD